MVLSTQLHITPCADLIAKVAPVENNRFIKPKYGMWTSTYRDGKSGWVEWCISESFSKPYDCNWFLLEPDPLGRILVVDTLADLKALLRQYPPPEPKVSSFFAEPDFERISQDWDAIHLTEEGQWATRMTIPSLYGWDAESTLWFRWCFTSYRQIQPTLVDPNPSLST